jgi:signal transduction histidine kinase/ligand-binding sensor domain-containing protein/AraC-like DNA-binding protein
MKIVLKNILLFVILTVIIFPQQKSTYQSNFPEPKYEYFNINNGLPNNTVWSIIQDKFGYLWFVTSNGLVKYDGYSMKVFRSDPDDSLSLDNRIINFVYEDRSGSLWVGSRTGLNLFNRKLENFKQYRGLNSLRTMSEDIAGNLWITSDQIIYLFDKQEDTFRSFSFPDTTVRIYALKSDNTDSSFYLGTSEGLYTFEPHSSTFKKFSNIIGVGAIYSIYITSDGTIWLGCDKGIASFNPQNSEINILPGIPLPVKVMIEDQDGFLWCYAGSQVWATTGNEMVIVNLRTKEYKRTNHDIIMSMCIDHSGILWLGTGWEGLFKWDKNKWKFKSYRNQISTNDPEKDNFVWKVHIDKNDILWLGTKNGLDKIDRRTGATKHYNFNNNEIKVIHDDGSGYLWLGTLKQGLIRFNPTTESVKYFSPDPYDSTSISSDHVFCILTDHTGVMWVGTRYEGLNRFDKKTEKFKQYKANPEIPGSISDYAIFDFIEDRNGYLWIGTDYGLNRYDRKTDTFIAPEMNRADPYFNNTTSAFEDSKGNLWQSTFFNGLYLYDREKFITIKNYNEKDGLAQNTIANIKEDKSGNLWIKTFNGISKFDPRTETFKNYGALDGLPEDMTRAFFTFQNSDGEIFFGSTNGYFSFHPDSIKDDPVPPKVVISSISLFNRPEETLNYDGFISEIKEINLPYNYNDLRFDFAALHFGEPSKNKYKYILENFDKDWVDAGTQRNATYTNLSPGEYTFRVIACNRDGIWNEEGASLKLIISPPFWATWWAYTFYVIFFGSVLYGIRRYEMNRVNLKNRVKLDEVKLKEKEETDRMKSRFFANISHEFRTPLTLILGPIQKWRERSESINSPAFQGGDKETHNTPEGLQSLPTELHKDLTMTERNARHLLSLVNQLLDLSKLEAGKLSLQVSKGNIVSFAKGVVMSFESLAERKGINLRFTSDKDEIELYFDRDKLAKILTNLLSNAFKFTNEGGTIEVRIELPNLKSPPLEGRPVSAWPSQEGGVGQKTYDASKFISISILDTGIGISEEELPKLFDRFYQVDSSQTREHEGTGIGLALTKELVELHKGIIKVNSKVGEGSEFIIELPSGRVHLKDDEIVESKENESSVILTPLERGKNLTEVIPENILIDSSSHFDPAGAGQAKLSVTVENQEDKTIILIVEDNRDVREYIKDSLGNNFQVEEAVNGENGVEKAKELIPDLIISDIMMPRMDGNELTRRIKNDERTSHIPVILLTAKSEQESKLEGLETGADDYLTKPFDTKELKVRIRNLIGIRKKLQEKYSRGDLIEKPDKKKLSTLDEKFMCKVNEVIENHISEEGFSIEEFDKEIEMGRVQIYRKIKALTGKSPSRYIRSVRLVKARCMIKEKQGTISEIAYSVGFSTPQYFTKCFKEEFGYPPSELTE